MNLPWCTGNILSGGFFIMFNDKILVCRDCGRDFEFSASEQEFYAEKGFTNEPGRCPECRAAKKAQNQGGGGYGRQERQMFPAVCATCGKEYDGSFPTFW